MRKILMIGSAALALGVAAVAMPTGAQARFGADAIAQATAAPSAQPVQYYGGYRSYYAPRYYGGGYYDYYRYGYPGSRDSLNTCAYC
jgi:hypothetical protein